MLIIKMRNIIMMSLVVVTTIATDPASEQLPRFKINTKGPIGILTNKNGAPVEIKDTSSLNTNLLDNEYFMDAISHQSHSKIPERIVHPKGAGAFGYFEVTHNISDICSASLFKSDGKKTPVNVRFSSADADIGGSDTERARRGFAIKFHTDEGNFDLVLLHTPLFTFNDPQLFTVTSKITRRNPQTNLKDPNMLWDFIAWNPEVLPYFLYLHGDDGIPDGYRYLPGYSIHTYQVYNKFGESYFVRFHVCPDSGIRNLLQKEATKLSCLDPDYAVRDLYNAIEKGDYPSWTVKVQVLSFEDLENCKFNPFSLTITIPEDEYPLRTVGKLILNSNPANYFADVEQNAFSPSYLVRGILGAPDNVFKARRFAYKQTQRYRLGLNCPKISVNKPITKIINYKRDGRPPIDINGGDAPNYYPNSFNGPVPYVEKYRPKLIKMKQYQDVFDFEQATERYIKLTTERRNRLIENIVETLHQTTKGIQKKIINLFRKVHIELALKTAAALTEYGKA